MTKSLRLLIVLLFLFSAVGFSQKVTLHGYLTDNSNGESLIGASVYVKGTSKGTVTNVYGFYSLSLDPGDYTIVYSYMGFVNIEKKIELIKDTKLSVELATDSEEIEEVVVTAKAGNDNIVSAKMGVQKLDSKVIDRVPTLLGEADVIRILQLTPGVVPTSEMSSNLSVRGGERDQNLILLDNATVYNASHLLGLFSVFNNDAIKNIDLYKGIIPSRFGGSISSVLDINMKEGNSKKFTGVGSIGLLTSRLTLEAPIVKSKGSVLISGRRTYIDVLTGLAEKINDKVSKVPYYFYDFNAKANYTLNDKHRIYLSGYFGRDVANLEIDDDAKQESNWGNYTTTLRWNYLVTKKLFANTTFLINNYDYYIDAKMNYGETGQGFRWDASLRDYGVKFDLGYFLNPDNTVKFGASSIYHDFNIAEVKGYADTMKFNFTIPKMYCLEHAAYIGNEQKIGDVLTLEYGLNISALQNMGSANVFTLENYNVVDTTRYGKNKIFNTYWNLDPRFSLSWIINPNNSIKAGYSRTHQYLHIASNSSAGTPLDVWMPVTPNVKPQYGHQASVGYFRNLNNDMYQISVEGYYKAMYNQIEFVEFSQPYFNEKIEEEFRFGKGRAYGLELMAKKSEGRYTGWIAYTLSKSERKIEDIQEKDWYPSSFDQRHNISIVNMLDITKRLSVSVNWLFNTGKPFDAPVSRIEYGNEIVPYYDGKNASRYPNYHRMDLGVELKNKPKKRYQTSWTFSVYNLYNRKNANSIYFKQGVGNTTEAWRYAMMKRIISASFNFKF